MARDHYRSLGLEPDASPEQVQAAYTHWSKELQPSQESAPTDELRQLQDSYSVVAHPQRRRAYDSRQKAEPMRASVAEPQPTREIHLLDSAKATDAHPSFEELFDRFWANFDLMSRPKAEQLQSLTIEVALSQEEARQGGHARILIPARAQCPACLGHGAVGFYQCWHCEGHGSITADYPLDVPYPARLANDHAVRISLEQFGIRNLYLTVLFRVAQDL